MAWGRQPLGDAAASGTVGSVYRTHAAEPSSLRLAPKGKRTETPSGARLRAAVSQEERSPAREAGRPMDRESPSAKGGGGGESGGTVTCPGGRGGGDPWIETPPGARRRRWRVRRNGHLPGEARRPMDRDTVRRPAGAAASQEERSPARGGGATHG